MVDIFGNNLIDAYTSGNPVSKIYSQGTLVWERSEPAPRYLTFTAEQAGSTVQYHMGAAPATVEYSLDNGNTWTNAGDVTVGLTNVGDKVMYRGVVSGSSTSATVPNRFVMTGRIAASGSVMSLVNNNPDQTSMNGYTYIFQKLFYGCTALTTAPELPATTLANGCYREMFRECTSLTTAPALPAMTVFQSSYNGMFYGCTALTTAPALPATELRTGCYSDMFYGCTSLTTAPALPATTLKGNCYLEMFYGCTSLTTAPELPATTLASMCYYYMFYECTSLNYVKAMFTTEPSESYTYAWLGNVSSSGSFIANPDATWPSSITRDISTVPEGWTIVQ